MNPRDGSSAANNPQPRFAVLQLLVVLLAVFAAGQSPAGSASSPSATPTASNPVPTAAASSPDPALRARAEAGDAKAQNQLGLVYRLGDGVAKDPAEALRWFLRAAKQKNGTAAFNVGTAYYNGEGVAVSDVDALAWFLYGDELGNSNAKAAAERTRQEMGPHAAEGEVTLAERYAKGELIGQDIAAAAHWYRAAADDGSALAQLKLGFLYDKGQGVENSPAQAFAWINRAAQQHFVLAMYSLAYLFDTGEGTPQDSQSAAKWYGKAALGGHPAAMLNLAVMTADGRGVKKDTARAYGLMRFAELEGLEQAKSGRLALEKSLSGGERSDGIAKVAAWYQNGKTTMLTVRPQESLIPEGSDPPANDSAEPIYKIGDGVKAPQVIFDPDPDYTPWARSKRIHGTVKLDTIVGTDGRTEDVKVVQSLEPGLDQQAVAALKTWRFRPATRNGSPVRVQMHIEINFRLW